MRIDEDKLVVHDRGKLLSPVSAVLGKYLDCTWIKNMLKFMTWAECNKIRYTHKKVKLKCWNVFQEDDSCYIQMAVSSIIRTLVKASSM